MIKAIIFDFGNVICRFTNEIYLEKISNLTGKTKDEIRDLIANSGLPKKFETGLISGQNFFKELSDLCGLKVSYEELKKIYSEDKFSRIYGIKELIEKLRKNYKVSLLSNTSEWDWDYMIKVAPEILTFDTVTKSYEARAMKPSKTIFRDALKKLNLKPEECVYTDDILEYVEVAKSLGFKAFQFTNTENFELDLKSLGIEIK